MNFHLLIMCSFTVAIIKIRHPLTFSKKWSTVFIRHKTASKLNFEKCFSKTAYNHVFAKF